MPRSPAFPTHVLGCFLALVCTTSAHAQFKCTDRDNKVTYQQHPCPENEQSATMRISSGAPSSQAAPASPTSNAGKTTTSAPVSGGSSGKTYRGKPCPTASEMADLDSKIAKMRQKNPDIGDGTREMFLTAALKTREDVKKACG